MIKFKNLFSFKRKEIKNLFEIANLKSRINGLKLLKASIDSVSYPLQNYGKILIITPRKSGKAVERNLLRRRVKEIFYKEKLYKIESNFVLLVYKETIKLSYNQIKIFMLNSINASLTLNNSRDFIYHPLFVDRKSEYFSLRITRIIFY